MLTLKKSALVVGCSVTKYNEPKVSQIDKSEGSPKRHYHNLQQTYDALERVLNGMSEGVTGDFLAMDIRQSLHYLGEITGTITTDDLLENIFSKFCIGK